MAHAPAAFLEADLIQAGRRAVLGSAVPHDEPAAIRLEDAGARLVGADHGPVVVEGQLPTKPRRSPLLRGPPDPKAWSRDD